MQDAFETSYQNADLGQTGRVHHLVIIETRVAWIVSVPQVYQGNRQPVLGQWLCQVQCLDGLLEGLLELRIRRKRRFCPGTSKHQLS